MHSEMPAKKRIEFTAMIKAPAHVVWQHVTSPESYAQWTSAFADGSHFRGSWEAGAKILFLGPNGNGMVSEIAEIRCNEFISIRHLGFISNGVEDTTSEAISKWAPAFENYTFIPMPDGTRFVVSQEVAAEWEEDIRQAWPKALELLTSLCESGVG